MLKSMALFIGRHALLLILLAIIFGLSFFISVALLILTVIATHLGYNASFGFIILQVFSWIFSIFLIYLFHRSLNEEEKEYYEDLEEKWKVLYRGRMI